MNGKYFFFTKEDFWILTILRSGVGVSLKKVGVGVSPWMRNHFDTERFSNVDNFEKRGWSIPLEGRGWCIPVDDITWWFRKWVSIRRFLAKRFIVNEDDKDVKYVCALIWDYGTLRYALESYRGDMETFECLETKLGKITQFWPKSKTGDNIVLSCFPNLF